MADAEHTTTYYICQLSTLIGPFQTWEEAHDYARRSGLANRPHFYVNRLETPRTFETRYEPNDVVMVLTWGMASPQPAEVVEDADGHVIIRRLSGHRYPPDGWPRNTMGHHAPGYPPNYRRVPHDAVRRARKETKEVWVHD